MGEPGVREVLGRHPGVRQHLRRRRPPRRLHVQRPPHQILQWGSKYIKSMNETHQTCRKQVGKWPNIIWQGHNCQNSPLRARAVTFPSQVSAGQNWRALMFAAGPNCSRPGRRIEKFAAQGRRIGKFAARVTQLSPQFAALPCKFCPGRELECPTILRVRCWVGG